MGTMTAEERAFWDAAAVQVTAANPQGTMDYRAEMGAKAADALLAERRKRMGAAAEGCAICAAGGHDPTDGGA